MFINAVLFIHDVKDVLSHRKKKNKKVIEWFDFKMVMFKFKIFLLKAHQQISKKWCFENYCSCDKSCQFSALYGTP